MWPNYVQNQTTLSSAYYSGSDFYANTDNTAQSAPLTSIPSFMPNFGISNGIFGAYQTPQTTMADPYGGGLMSYIMQLIQMLTSGGLGNQLANGTSLGEDVVIEDEILGAWGDPHFNFKDKSGKNVTIDHKGITGETYNVLNADGLDIDAEYKYWDEKSPQVMGAVKIQAGNQQLLLHNGKTTIDGKEIKAGEKARLADGRTVTVEKNGNVKITTKDGKGEFDIKNKTGKNGSYYDIDPSGTVNIHKDGGILGFLWNQGKTKTKKEILDKYDTNKNGILDAKDQKMEQAFRAKSDLGFYATKK